MRAITTFALAALLALAACSAATTQAPSPGSTQAPPSDPTPGPSVGPTASASQPGAATIELALLANVRLDLQGRCAPLRAGLATAALTAVECAPASDVVGHVTISAFDTQQDLLDAYLVWLVTHDIPRRTNGGRCEVGHASEGSYMPGDGGPILAAERGGCYVDSSGKAHYAATVPPFVLIELDGKVDDMAAVERFGWLGNQDQPGNPTIWRSTGPASPEK